MSEMSNEAIQASIRQRGLATGNEVRDANDVPVTTTLKQVYVDANSDLQVSTIPLVEQPTITSALAHFTGTPNGNIMTQTIVAAASATTATAAGWLRVDVVSGNSAIFSTSAYYIPLVTLT